MVVHSINKKLKCILYVICFGLSVAFLISSEAHSTNNNTFDKYNIQK